MQSWSLEKFVNEYGVVKASLIWGKSHQTVGQAIESTRSIKIVQVGRYYEVHEFKMLGRAKVVNIDLKP